MNISVALCTYNGARFLREQLASIAAQELLPDELVVCDDGSTDATANIVAQFAAHAPFPVRFSVNPQRLGSTRNFDRAIGQCAGRVIVLADQDDVWLPHKVKSLRNALTAAPDAGFVFSNALLVTEDLQPIGYTLWDAIRFTQSERRRMRAGRIHDVLLREHYVVTGATMAFRSEYRPLILPIPPTWVHDAWIAILIGAVSRCEWISDPLIQYRQHSDQQFGEQKRNLYKQFLIARSMNQETFQGKVEAYSQVAERLQTVSSVKVSGGVLAALDQKVFHFQTRKHMRDTGVWRFPLVLQEIAKWRYQRYSLGWKSIAQDLFL